MLIPLQDYCHISVTGAGWTLFKLTGITNCLLLVPQVLLKPVSLNKTWPALTGALMVSRWGGNYLAQSIADLNGSLVKG